MWPRRSSVRTTWAGCRAKGRSWTHVWDQAFTDRAALERYLRTRDGVATSSLEGFKRLGVDVSSIKILSFPFTLKPASAQTPAPMPADDLPVLYAITVRLAPADVDVYLELLERHYDPYIADGGGELVHRRRSVDQAYGEVEVQSTWQLDSMAAYSDIRAATLSNPGWHAYVRDGMPLVQERHPPLLPGRLTRRGLGLRRLGTVPRQGFGGPMRRRVDPAE